MPSHTRTTHRNLSAQPLEWDVLVTRLISYGGFLFCALVFLTHRSAFVNTIPHLMSLPEGDTGIWHQLKHMNLGGVLWWVLWSFNFLLYHMLVHGNPGYLDTSHHKNSSNSDKKDDTTAATAVLQEVEEGRHLHSITEDTTTLTAAHSSTSSRYRPMRSSPSFHDDYNGDNGDSLREAASQKQMLPIRSRYCKQCRRHIATYDHHCVWLNTCVGEKNRGAFCLLLFSLALFSVYSLFGAVSAVYYTHRVDLSVTKLTLLTYVAQTSIVWIACMVAFFTSIVLTIFCVATMWLASSNVTTLEYHTPWKAHYLGGAAHEDTRRFDEGCWQNTFTVCLKTLTEFTSNFFQSLLSGGQEVPYTEFEQWKLDYTEYDEDECSFCCFRINMRTVCGEDGCYCSRCCEECCDDD